MSKFIDTDELFAQSVTTRKRSRDRKGATPSNTAPSNYMIDSFLPLRNGVDSLYFSWKGDIWKEAEEKLETLKKYAQSDVQAHLAQLQVKDHVFMVRDKGRSNFAYLLTGACFEIALNNSSSLMPVAYVKVASHYLAGKTPQDAYNDLFGILNEICYLESNGTISRVDLFLDFCVEDGFIQNLSSNEIIHTADMCSYRDKKGDVTGHSFGLGGDITCRIYNKTLHIQLKDGQGHLPLLWKKAGWDGDKTVWRIEFQLRRNALAQFEISSVQDLESRQAALWQHLTQKWLRIVIPDAKNKNRSRLKTHPIWEMLSNSFAGEEEQVLLKRIKKDSAPDEGNILRGIAGYLASWMALRNITDVRYGIKVFISELLTMLLHYQTGKGIRLFDYMEQTIPHRIRKFNLRRNDDSLFSISNFDGLGGY